MMFVSVRGPIAPSPEAPTWADAAWVGEVRHAGDEVAAGQEEPVRLRHAEGYSRARLLVRDRDGRPRGVVAVPVTGGAIDAGVLRRALTGLPVHPPAEPVVRRPAISVVLCTRDRPEDLAVALDSLLRQDYPDFEVVVVDNAPTTDATTITVAALADPRVRVVTEPVPGLSNARNAGVAAARHEWIAFTDDDVIVDEHWLRGIARGIRPHGRPGQAVGAVTGLVVAAELRTPSQAWFESRVSWSDSLAPRVFDVRRPPDDVALFPFRVGAYGTGANFAVHRRVLAEVGGFDPRLGAGSPALGGEDIDFFYRLVVRGHQLSYEPSALVWHRHRDSPAALRAQAVGYGRGFSSWLTKLALSPADLARGLVVLARHPRLVRRHATPTTAQDDVPELPGTERIGAIERRALAGGPAAYLGHRRHAR